MLIYMVKKMFIDINGLEFSVIFMLMKFVVEGECSEVMCKSVVVLLVLFDSDLVRVEGNFNNSEDVVVILKMILIINVVDGDFVEVGSVGFVKLIVYCFLYFS